MAIIGFPKQKRSVAETVGLVLSRKLHRKLAHVGSSITQGGWDILSIRIRRGGRENSKSRGIYSRRT
jgi:hypothetical protein